MYRVDVIMIHRTLANRDIVIGNSKKERVPLESPISDLRHTLGTREAITGSDRMMLAECVQHRALLRSSWWEGVVKTKPSSQFGIL